MVALSVPIVSLMADKVDFIAGFCRLIYPIQDQNTKAGVKQGSKYGQKKVALVHSECTISKISPSATMVSSPRLIKYNKKKQSRRS